MSQRGGKVSVDYSGANVGQGRREKPGYEMAGDVSGKKNNQIINCEKRNDLNVL